MASLRKAIDLNCLDCAYDPLDAGGGNWRQQVTACPVTDCALWHLRPVSRPHKGYVPKKARMGAETGHEPAPDS